MSRDLDSLTDLTGSETGTTPKMPHDNSFPWNVQLVGLEELSCGGTEAAQGPCRSGPRIALNSGLLSGSSSWEVWLET